MFGRVISFIAISAAPWLGILAIWYGMHYSGFINPALVPAPHRWRFASGSSWSGAGCRATS